MWRWRRHSCQNNTSRPPTAALSQRSEVEPRVLRTECASDLGISKEESEKRGTYFRGMMWPTSGLLAPSNRCAKSLNQQAQTRLAQTNQFNLLFLQAPSLLPPPSRWLRDTCGTPASCAYPGFSRMAQGRVARASQHTFKLTSYQARLPRP